MKHIWQIVVLALLGCAISISFALLMSHVVVRVLEHEEARELEIAREAYRQGLAQAEMVPEFLETYGSYSWNSVVLSCLPNFDLHEQEMKQAQGLKEESIPSLSGMMMGG